MTIDVTEHLAAFRPYDIEDEGVRGRALDGVVKRWFGSDRLPPYPPDDPHWKAVDLLLDLEGWDSVENSGKLTVVSNALAEFFLVLDDVAGELSESRGDRQWLRVRGPGAVRMMRDAHARLGEVLDEWVTKAARPPAPAGAVTAGELIAKLATVPPETPVEWCEDINEAPPDDPDAAAPISPVRTVRYDAAAEAVTIG